MGEIVLRLFIRFGRKTQTYKLIPADANDGLETRAYDFYRTLVYSLFQIHSSV